MITNGFPLSSERFFRGLFVLMNSLSELFVLLFHQSPSLAAGLYTMCNSGNSYRPAGPHAITFTLPRIK